MTMTTLDNALAEGLRLFDAGEFYEAHDAWEPLWMEAEGTERFFVQGLIELAGALHKGLRMHHPTGMESLAHQAAQKLAHVSRKRPALGGLDVAAVAVLAHDIETAARTWAQAGGNYAGPTPALQPFQVTAQACCGCR